MIKIGEDYGPDIAKDPEKVEKAAKATSSMFENLIDAAISGIPQLTALVSGLQMSAPFIEPFIKFLNIFQAAMAAGMSEAVALLYEKLFTEKNVELMIALGEATGETFGVKIEKAIENTERLGMALDKISGPLETANKLLGPFGDHISDLNAFVQDGTVNMDKMVRIGEDLIRKYKELNEIMEDIGEAVGDIIG